MKHRKELNISTRALEDFLKNPTPPGITQDGLPEDAEIVGARYDSRAQLVVLTIASAEFDPGGGPFVKMLMHQTYQETV